MRNKLQLVKEYRKNTKGIQGKAKKGNDQKNKEENLKEKDKDILT